MMSFDRSTQSKSWIFSEGDLSLCRTKATSERLDFRKQNEAARVRKFASGFRFHANTSRQRHQSALQKDNILPPSLSLSPLDQDVLVRFHAHQISMLIGPDAILPCLVRSDDVYATAIMIFRRFYLSNSVLDFSPRRMATAACFLASKLEENRIEISLLSNATAVIYEKIKNAPLCRRELNFVSVSDIEAGERDLMEGLNYEMRFHHPFSAIEMLCTRIYNFMTGLASDEEAELCGTSFYYPKRFLTRCETFRKAQAVDLIENAMLIATNALIFSDAPFLFPPGQIAFAAVAMAMRVNDAYSTPRELIHPTLCAFLRNRFSSKNEHDLNDFEHKVSRIIHHLMASPVMDLKLLSLSRPSEEGDAIITEQAERLRQVFHKVSIIRGVSTRRILDPIGNVRKRKHNTVWEFILSSPGHDVCTYKVARITPTKVLND